MQFTALLAFAAMAISAATAPTVPLVVQVLSFKANRRLLALLLRRPTQGWRAGSVQISRPICHTGFKCTPVAGNGYAGAIYGNCL
ncbi:hypothetical protein BDR26DRAFT_937585 [Obelidium mucronatum]|nr:hypothetical protein BDR26DRAFT_937585 [Obelidium mucronatum]